VVKSDHKITSSTSLTKELEVDFYNHLLYAVPCLSFYCWPPKPDI
ncbi:hypothetical protein TorRG33x02_193560, partial [Trema orientale]